MNIPSSSQIKEAYDEITERGNSAEATLALSILILKNPTLRAIVVRHAQNLLALQKGPGLTPELTEGIIMGAYLAGLNMGLTIKS